MEYFKYLPKLEYSNDQAINIMARGKIREYIKNNIYTYYDYLLEDGERPDILSHTYYGSTKYSWLLFYANDIYDPFLDWIMNTSEFRSYMVHKYHIGQYVTRFNTNIFFDASKRALGTSDESTKEELLRTTPGSFIEISGSLSGLNDGIYQITNHLDDEETGNFYVGVRPHRKLLGEVIEFSSEIVNQVVGEEITIEYPEPETILHHYEDYDDDVVDEVTYLALPSIEVETDRIKDAVSFAEWEERMNEAKRSIKVIDNRYLPQILNEIRTLFDAPA